MHASTGRGAGLTAAAPPPHSRSYSSQRTQGRGESSPAGKRRHGAAQRKPRRHRRGQAEAAPAEGHAAPDTAANTSSGPTVTWGGVGTAVAAVGAGPGAAAAAEDPHRVEALDAEIDAMLGQAAHLRQLSASAYQALEVCLSSVSAVKCSHCRTVSGCLWGFTRRCESVSAWVCPAAPYRRRPVILPCRFTVSVRLSVCVCICCLAVCQCYNRPLTRQSLKKTLPSPPPTGSWTRCCRCFGRCGRRCLKLWKGWCVPFSVTLCAPLAVVHVFVAIVSLRTTRRQAPHPWRLRRWHRRCLALKLPSRKNSSSSSSSGRSRRASSPRLPQLVAFCSGLESGKLPASKQLLAPPPMRSQLRERLARRFPQQRLG